MQWVGVVGATVSACLMWFVTAPTLRALPEPVGTVDKLPYADLVTVRFATTVAACSGLASLTVVWSTPPSVWLAWSALIGPGVLSACIDARTTYLPKVLAQVSWLLAGFGAGWVALTTSSLIPLVLAGLGATALGGFFWLVWRISRGIGFGDVRLMVTIGAVCGLTDPRLIAWAALAGTFTGAGWGVVHRLTKGRGPFPYGPGLLAGPFVALWIQPLVAA